MDNTTPLLPWAKDFARRWNSAAYSVVLMHGNIFDVYPVQGDNGTDYVSLKSYILKRLFPNRKFVMFYDISDGLTFATQEMQSQFMKWLAIFDEVEDTQYAVKGPPKDFNKLAPLLRRFFIAGSELCHATLVIDYPEKIIPASEDAGSTQEERIALINFLKWATAQELRQKDVAILLVTETASKLQSDLLQNPHIAQIRVELPELDDRARYLQSAAYTDIANAHKDLVKDLSAQDLAIKTSGLNLVRLQNLISEALNNNIPLTAEYVSKSKKTLIEEYCQGLVKFKDPRPGMTLDAVATHTAAKKKLREIAWLFKNNKLDVIEKGVLLPGRIGVGKSFLIDCFASECGLPMMELGDFRSKWVGDTERQQNRILMTIKALGPVIVVVDEADAVFGTRGGGEDNGISGRVFAAFAAHIGDASLRGRELWIAMTSRPDLLTIDLKRQGRFGLCIPLFPSQAQTDVADLFTTVAKTKNITLTEENKTYIMQLLGDKPLTGSDVEAIITRAKENAVLDKHDNDIQVKDIEVAVNSFIDPLDPDLLALQELAAVLACSDSRYLPASYLQADRSGMTKKFNALKSLFSR